MDRSSSLPSNPAQLAEEIAVLATHIDAALHRLLTCIRAFDESGEWATQGAISCAHWLSWRIHLDLGTAREKVRVARALGGLPAMDGSLRCGVLSYAKVRALTRVATAQNEAQLLEIAHHSTGAQLERFCRTLRKVVAVDERGNRSDDYRRVHEQVMENGMVRLTAVLHPDEAAVVMKAIEEARRDSPAPAGKASRSFGDGADAAGSGTHALRAARDVSAERRKRLLPSPDALVAIAMSYLKDREASPRPGLRAQLVVHLERDPIGAAGAMAATLDDGTRLSAETFRRLACDCSVVPLAIAPGGGAAAVARLDLGRQTRTVSPPLRRALELRDRGCRFPGCTHHRFLHAHHIRHWSHGGPTSLRNLVLLCTHHHRLLHEGGYSIKSEGIGTLGFRGPRGERIAEVPPPAELVSCGDEAIAAWNRSAGLDIDPNTAYPAWDGWPMDYEAAVDATLSG
jgi:hypothetical protein